MADLRWLERRGQTYYAVQAVPRNLWGAVGKRRFVASLKTSDLIVAQGRRHAALADFARSIEAARKAAKRTPQTDTATQRGVAHREVLEAIKKGDKAVIRRFKGEATDQHGEPMSEAAVALEVAEMSLWNEADDLDDAERATMLAIAQGVATPVLLHVDRWLAEGGARGPLKPRTADMYRSDLAGLASWLLSERLPATAEAITRDVAGRWVGHLQSTGVRRATINRKITAAASYWRWLAKRTSISVSPWVGQALSVTRRPGEEREKRPFTDDELRRLLNPGETGAAIRVLPTILDAVRIAALTGMRLEEIAQLRVKDARDGWLFVTGGKTAASVRRVPVHPDLADLVAARVRGKTPAAFLLHEWGPEARPGRERSAPFSKTFARYRVALKVDEVRPGQRYSRVDFRSFRRWAATRLRQAGVDLAVAQAILGHRAGNLTDDTYSEGPAADQLQAAIRTIQLPT